MNEARLQELRAEHRPCHEDCPDEHPFCTNYYCDEQGIGWPCEQSQILDLALEAERLRTDRDLWQHTAMKAEESVDALQAEAERLRAALAVAKTWAEANRRLRDSVGWESQTDINLAVDLYEEAEANLLSALAGTEGKA